MGKEDFYYRPIPPERVVRYLVWIVPIVLVLIMASTSFYMVNTDEEGVVQRFGRYVRTTGPGLHFKLPMGIEAVSTPHVTRVFKEEFGFRTLKAGVQTRYGQRPEEEYRMLCGDLSVAEVEWTVQYKIKDAREYLFNARNPEKVLRDVAESVMRSVVGDSSVDEVLTSRRVEINDAVAEKMQQLLDTYTVGLHVESVMLQDVNPPEKVQPAFNEVNTAEQDKQRLVNQALEEYNKVIPRASGQAHQMVDQAKAYAIDRTNRAQGDANRFREIWKEYSLNKDVTRRRLYIEAMGKVLPNLEKKYIIDDNVKGLLPLMNVGEK
ncbi:MAG: FtsH protease activity modulator HflK [Planctomycetota bacterium]|nr:MAG: FtsH protease activity modulator HflK [Planctomycetota bacterium]